MSNILEKLKNWQSAQAAREGVQGYRVLPYKTLQELAQVVPQNELELLAISGIGATKVRRYGRAVLAILKDSVAQNAQINSVQSIQAIQTTQSAQTSHNAGTESGVGIGTAQQSVGTADTGVIDEPLSVGVFLDAVNAQLAQNVVRVRGEVVSVNVYPRAVYFSIKDATDGSVLSCVIFRYQYDMAGVELVAGMEVIVGGSPEVYKPNGRFNLKATMLELAGEGALKKAYEELKRKLAAEGLFDQLRKRPVPNLPTRIGLITSRDSAAIGDFRSNVGVNGLEIKFAHASVEGARAVPEILRALEILAQTPIDVLVLTRGGGSLESLQAFNNEAILRKLVDFGVPVIAGIGHDRDETLATLVADIGVSTPTAAALAVRASWDSARERLAYLQKSLLDNCQSMIGLAQNKLEVAPYRMSEFMREVVDKFYAVKVRFARRLTQYESALKAAQLQFVQSGEVVSYKFAQILNQFSVRLEQNKMLLVAHNPERLLKRGYAIVRDSEGRIVRKVGDVNCGDKLAIALSDGIINMSCDGGRCDKQSK